MSSAAFNLAATLYPLYASLPQPDMPELWTATINSPEPWDKTKTKQNICFKFLLGILFSVSLDTVVQYSLVRLIPIPKAPFCENSCIPHNTLPEI